VLYFAVDVCLAVVVGLGVVYDSMVVGCWLLCIGSVIVVAIVLVVCVGGFCLGGGG